MLFRATIAFCFMLIVSAEKECAKNEDCDMEGSICDQQQTCVCPSDKIANSLHTKCLPVAEGYGSPCSDNVQCSQGLNSGGICVNSTCECMKGYHYFLGRCWKSSGLGENCKHNENCFVNNDFEAALCSEKQVCVCSPGYYQREYSSCRRESYKPGDSCGIYLDCKFENAVCNQNRTCQIGDGSVSGSMVLVDKEFNNYVQADIQLGSTVGETCNNNENCPQNAECNKANICVCKQGYYKTADGTCAPELGAKCDQDSNCLGKNTQCRNGTVCVCKQGFVTSYNGRYCDKLSRNIAWSCLRDEQCSFFGPRSSCVNKKCRCNTDAHFVENQLYCWVQKLVGDSCFSDEDCGDGKSALCSGGSCKCAANTHPSVDKNSCRNDSNSVGEPCSENIDCTFNYSVCDKNQKLCICMKGYFNSNGNCVPGVGGKCDKASDCEAIVGSACVKGVCTCEEGFISSQNYSKCLPLVTLLNATCIETVQCSKIEAVCDNGYCSCEKGSHFVEGWHCFISRSINQTCTYDGNCTIPHSYCLGRLCQCRPHFHPNRAGTKCHGSSNIIEPAPMLTMILFVSVVFSDRWKHLI